MDTLLVAPIKINALKWGPEADPSRWVMVDITDNLEDCLGLPFKEHYRACTPCALGAHLFGIQDAAAAAAVDKADRILLNITVSPNSPWNDFSSTEWTTFCESFLPAFPRLEEFRVNGALFLGDEKLCKLILHLPATVICSKIFGVLCDLPKTFLAIGFAFPNLKEINFHGLYNCSNKYEKNCIKHMVRGGMMMTNHSITALTYSMSRLRHSLVGFSFGHMVAPDAERLIAPLVAALQQTTSLKHVHMPEIKNLRVWPQKRRYKLTKIDAGYKDSVQFGPRIQAALQKAGGGPYFDMTPTQMVDAIISLGDRVDCLYYLFSQNPVFPQQG